MVNKGMVINVKYMHTEFINLLYGTAVLDDMVYWWTREWM